MRALSPGALRAPPCFLRRQCNSKAFEWKKVTSIHLCFPTSPRIEESEICGAEMDSYTTRLVQGYWSREKYATASFTFLPLSSSLLYAAIKLPTSFCILLRPAAIIRVIGETGEEETAARNEVGYVWAAEGEFQRDRIDLCLLNSFEWSCDSSGISHLLLNVPPSLLRLESSSSRDLELHMITILLRIADLLLLHSNPRRIKFLSCLEWRFLDMIFTFFFPKQENPKMALKKQS
ncbi:hypothetical protein C4D60_Mb04t11680 [Musa balbisiana]|uniref:Uncharacterized protein n=1 Tax=Musa balbisiana TaxID=52838 RepID=A0A4S8KBD1_MUSBA|nr:hypothetical protein C4D60_Mb04t11680 [Musa balbisiana]